MTQVDVCYFSRIENLMCADSVCVSMLFSTDSSLDDLSDSETEELAEMKIDEWLVFQLDREVREHCYQH